MRTVFLSPSGHFSIGPSGVDAQSKVCDEFSHPRQYGPVCCRRVRVDGSCVHFVHRAALPITARPHDLRI